MSEYSKHPLYSTHAYTDHAQPQHYTTHRVTGYGPTMSPHVPQHMIQPDYSHSPHTLPHLPSYHEGGSYMVHPPAPMPLPINGNGGPAPLNTSHIPRKRRMSDDSYSTSASTLAPVLSAGSGSTYADADSVQSFMGHGQIPDQSPLSSSMPPPMSSVMGNGAPLTQSTSAPNLPIVKKSRVNTPWTPAEEHRLKVARDNGDSWAVIAKSFPNRTEGSVKKHWYKDMHYAEFAEDEALLSAIREYEASKWKVIGAKVGKPAKACEQYAKEHFTKEQLAPKAVVPNKQQS